jgi:hypothetical protein
LHEGVRVVGIDPEEQLPSPLAATDMLPPIRKARPPNMAFSVTPGSSRTSARMRLARSSS